MKESDDPVFEVIKPKVYAKGTKVWLWWCTHDRDSKVVEPYTLDADMTEDDLEKLAEESFWNDKEPAWGFSEEKPKKRAGLFDTG